jgi:hypothetical protein
MLRDCSNKAVSRTLLANSNILDYQPRIEKLIRHKKK